MRLLEHGGRCCGIRHIYHFPVNAEQQEVAGAFIPRDQGDGDAPRMAAREALPYLLREADANNPPRLTEAVLTDRQLPVWEPILTAQGFRKTVRFRNGNTGHYCNIFYRYQAPHFEVFGATQPPAAVPGGREPFGDFDQCLDNVEVICTNRAIDRFGQTARIIRSDRYYGARGGIKVRWNADGAESAWFAFTSFGPFVGQAQPAAPVPLNNQPVIDTLRFQNQGLVATVERLTRELTAAQRVTDVYTSYHCVYRDGRTGAGYETADAARAANPRARSLEMRVVRSDGTIARRPVGL